ncbi:MAG TPA: HAD family hydrolase [Bryobacteraceae bacterium]|nr:HAD family hydrolase [Bryobacteraceae bacterium]
MTLPGILLVFGSCGPSGPPATESANKAVSDPLPSWSDTATKKTIMAFVEKVTTASGPDFVTPEDRIATFDNDGTLWAEQPIIESLFAMHRLKTAAEKTPSLKSKQSFKAFLEDDKKYLGSLDHDELLNALLQLIMVAEANTSREEFQASAAEFMKTATYPKPAPMPVKKATYQPMIELLEYLRANGFETWLCSGGTTDFMRTISQEYYGIPTQQVMGTRFKQQYKEINGRLAIWRLPQIESINDKYEKPVNIALNVGKRPSFVAGNVRSGGDIGQLSYSQGRSGPSFQLLINHDDAGREFAYQEKDNASLNAAKAGNWTVVSMKNDWKQIFRTAP